MVMTQSGPLAEPTYAQKRLSGLHSHARRSVVDAPELMLIPGPVSVSFIELALRVTPATVDTWVAVVFPRKSTNVVEAPQTPAAVQLHVLKSTVAVFSTLYVDEDEDVR
jgi:hypothetical protein